MLLTVDIGTSNFKSALWDYEGNRLSYVSCPLSIDGDCGQWRRAFEYCCKKLGNQAKVKAIVICGNGPTLVPVLKDNTAADALLWLDRSAEEYQEEVSAVQGGFVDAAFFLPKILKIKNEEPELYRHTKHFLGCPEYLAYVLTGEARSVFPSDGFDRWFWNDSVLKKLGIDAAKMPPFIRPAEPFGTLTKKNVQYFGFKENTPIISGGPDFFAAILGAGVTKPGQALDRTGSSEGINLCTTKKIQHDRLMSYGHPIKPYSNLSGKINMSGLAIEQASEILGLSTVKDLFAIVEKRDAANSVLEELCFEVKEIIEEMEKNGVNVTELRVTGGMAANEYFNQLKADITGKTILAPKYKEAELLGCAIIGACYFGKFASFSEACGRLVKIEKRYLAKIGL